MCTSRLQVSVIAALLMIRMKLRVGNHHDQTPHSATRTRARTKLARSVPSINQCALSRRGIHRPTHTTPRTDCRDGARSSAAASRHGAPVELGE
jgi:hypothetical protein